MVDLMENSDELQKLIAYALYKVSLDEESKRHDGRISLFDHKQVRMVARAVEDGRMILVNHPSLDLP